MCAFTRDEESRSKLVSNCVNVVTNMEAKKEAFEELVKPTDIQVIKKYEFLILNLLSCILILRSLVLNMGSHISSS